MKHGRIFYPAIALQSLSLWNCVTVGDKSFLAVDLSVVCEGPTYQFASSYNVVFVIGVVVGWPAFLIFYLRRLAQRGVLDVERVRDRVGFLYDKFKPAYLFATLSLFFEIRLSRDALGQIPMTKKSTMVLQTRLSS